MSSGEVTAMEIDSSPSPKTEDKVEVSQKTRDLVHSDLRRTFEMFQQSYHHHLRPFEDQESQRVKLSAKLNSEYANVKDLDVPPVPGTPPHQYSKERKSSQALVTTQQRNGGARRNMRETMDLAVKQTQSTQDKTRTSRALTADPYKRRRPEWHAPWKLMRVISGHQGWVRALAVDCGNEWFVTGSLDRTIRVWDLASGALKLTLTGHVAAVRDVCVSDRRPYMFSVGEDHDVKCWDLEQNKVIKSYYGHLSAVYCCALHPAQDILVTGGRDSTVRVWDMRTKTAIHVLSSHNSTVGAIVCQSTEPQIISGSYDNTIRCWDIVAGKTRTTLTHHKKSVRALALHPTEYTFASGAPDNIKKWKCPEARFMHNLSGHNAIVNTLSVNSDNVLFSGGDDGSMYFWDWKTGHCFQNTKTTPQPGSLDSEAGIFASTFDMSGSRLLTAEADKTIKVWKEDEQATPETHPIQFEPEVDPKRY